MLNSLLSKTPSLEPEVFAPVLFEENWWEKLGITYYDSMDKEIVFFEWGKYVIGWCDAGCLHQNAKNGYYALMFAKNGQVFWTYVMKRLVDLWLEEFLLQS